MDDINRIEPTKEELRPKYIPFKCPNCNGYGTVMYGKKVCHSCKGKGYVVIKQEERGEINE